MLKNGSAPTILVARKLNKGTLKIAESRGQQCQKYSPPESLRGIAALSAVMFHFQVGSNFNNPFTHNGSPTVDFFLVLSGFRICLNYHNRLTDTGSAIAFQKRRFWGL